MQSETKLVDFQSMCTKLEVTREIIKMNVYTNRKGEDGNVPFRSDRFFAPATDGISQPEKALTAARTHRKREQQQV